MGTPFTSPPFFVYNVTPVYLATELVTFEVTGLEEYNNYTFSVAAANSDMGAYTTDLFIRTLQAGNLLRCTITIRNWCRLIDKISIIHLNYYL